MNRYKFLMCMFMALWASALSAQTHWTFDYRQYQYDMTVYFMLKNGERDIKNLNDYEVAALVGDQCRGIGQFQSAIGSNGQTVTYGYLRIYSNQVSGETVSIKVYDKKNDAEVDVTADAIVFESMAVLGYPSTPVAFGITVLSPALMGDADGDGEVTVNDVIMAVQASLGNVVDGLDVAAADMDGDGEITVNDIIMIIQLSLQN